MAISLYRRRDPLENYMQRWQDDMDRWFGTSLFTAPEGEWMPAVDIEQKDGSYILRADLPGIKKEDVHLELEDGYLTLSGERKDEREEKGGRYCRIERTYGSFQRSFRVPEGVTEKDISAHFRDGVMEISIPVPEAKKTAPKSISIT